MADKDKREQEPEPDPAAQVRTIGVAGTPPSGPPRDAPVAAAPAVISRFTPEEIGPGPAFDPTIRFKTAPVAGPDLKGKKVKVFYRGPSDNFLVGEHTFDRLNPTEVPEGVLTWLRANQPAHAFEEVAD